MSTAAVTHLELSGRTLRGPLPAKALTRQIRAPLAVLGDPHVPAVQIFSPTVERKRAMA